MDEELELEWLEDVNESAELIELEQRLIKRKRRLLWMSVLVAVMLLGVTIGNFFVSYQRQYVDKEDFVNNLNNYYYEDDQFMILSYNYLDDLNLKAINDLYGKVDDVLRLFGMEKIDKVRINFYGDRTMFKGRYNPESYSGGYYIDQTIHILNPNAKKMNHDPVVKDTHYEHILLVHEFVHAVQEAKTLELSQIRWLTEGLADYISFELVGRYRLALEDRYKGQEIEVIQLSDFNLDDDYAYKYGMTLIDYFIQTYGDTALKELLLDPKMDEITLIESITGEPVDVFMTKWHQFLVDDYKMILSEAP